MSRTVKNIIMIIMLIVVLLLMSVTVYKATDERVSVTNGIGGVGGMGGDPNVMGEMQGNNLVLEDGTTFFPDGTAVKPDGTPLTQDEINALMPGAPGGAGGMGTPPDGVGGGQGPMSEAEIKELDKIYYVYFGVESLVFLLILAYMILSGFNKKSFSETFDEKIKFILLAIIAVFGTAIFTYACNFISNTLTTKIAEMKEAEANSATQGTTDPNMGMGTTTDQNAVTVPEGGEVVNPNQNQNMDAVPGTQVQPDNDQNTGTTPEGGDAMDSNQGVTSQPTTGETPSTENPMEGGQTPPQMP